MVQYSRSCRSCCWPHAQAVAQPTHGMHAAEHSADQHHIAQPQAPHLLITSRHSVTPRSAAIGASSRSAAMQLPQPWALGGPGYLAMALYMGPPMMLPPTAAVNCSALSSCSLPGVAAGEGGGEVLWWWQQGRGWLRGVVAARGGVVMWYGGGRRGWVVCGSGCDGGGGVT